MADNVEHCPFLNRSDARCAENFNIDHLQHAFRFCFSRYKACTMYVELLVERRMRRGDAGAAAAAAATAPERLSTDVSHADRFVQITLPARHAQQTARAA